MENSKTSEIAGGNQVWLCGSLNSYYEYGCSVCETPDSAFLICRTANGPATEVAPERQRGRDCRRLPYMLHLKPGQGNGYCYST